METGHGETEEVKRKAKSAMSTVDQKLAELILYVASACEGDESFGSTKLNKILFLCDFLAYRKLGAPITGAEYHALPHGPAPRRLLQVLSALEQSGAMKIRSQKRFGYEQKRPLALREPDLSHFTADQIVLVNHIIRGLWGRSATEVSELSHRFWGWQLAEEKEVIPYGLALLAEDAELSERGKKLADELAEYAAKLTATDAS